MEKMIYIASPFVRFSSYFDISTTLGTRPTKLPAQTCKRARPVTMIHLNGAIQRCICFVSTSLFAKHALGKNEKRSEKLKTQFSTHKHIYKSATIIFRCKSSFAAKSITFDFSFAFVWPRVRFFFFGVAFD